MLKLSEGMRLGAMIRGQAFGVAYDGSRSCALGAAFEAVGLRDHFQGYMDFENDLENDPWTWADDAKCDCPVCGAPDSVAFTIVHLNDTHRWSRQSIADWVATVEPSEVPSVAEQSKELVHA